MSVQNIIKGRKTKKRMRNKTLLTIPVLFVIVSQQGMTAVESVEENHENTRLQPISSTVPPETNVVNEFESLLYPKDTVISIGSQEEPDDQNFSCKEEIKKRARRFSRECLNDLTKILGDVRPLIRGTITAAAIAGVVWISKLI